MHMTRSQHTPHNNEPIQSIPRASVKLGSHPGTLIAALPAMMGFTPSQSIIVVGLYRNPAYSPGRNDIPASCRPSAYRVGPVVRTDLDFGAVGEAIDTLDEVLNQCDDPSAIVVCVHTHKDTAEDYLDGTKDMLEMKGIDVLDAIYLAEIASGEKWVDVASGDSGVVGNIVDNPMRSHTAVRQARVFATRSELEHWLDIDAGQGAVYPRRYADAQLDPTEAVALLKDLHVFATAVDDIRSGAVTLEEVCARRRMVVAVSAIARDEGLLSVLSTLGAGSNAPIVREILAEATRRTRSGLRLRLMAVLASILMANGEGMPAFHTLNRVLEGARERGPDTPLGEATIKIATTLRHALMEGRGEAVTDMVALHGLMVLSNWEFPCTDARTGSCGRSVDELRQTWQQIFSVLLRVSNEAIDWAAMSDAPSEPGLQER